MAPRHTHDTAAPRVSGKPGPPPKWHALLDRVAANPLDAGSRHAEPRHDGSALSVKADRDPIDRASVVSVEIADRRSRPDTTVGAVVSVVRVSERGQKERGR